MPPESKEKQTVTFGAVGDIELDGQCGQQLDENGMEWAFGPMLPHLRSADVLFGNLESIVLPPEYPDDQIDPAGLITKFDGTPALVAGGFDFLNMASNHVLDGGQVSMFHTRRLVEELGIATGGVGRTQQEARQLRTLEKAGVSFGFLCYAEDSNYSLSTTGPAHAYYRLESVLEDVAAARGKVDVLVVSIHADLEFMETPSVPRLRAARRIASAGADIILQHHPHVPQGVEMIDGSLVAYSLGNFYFAAHTSEYMKNNGPHTAHSFLLLAEVSGDGVESFARVPFEIAPPPEQRPAPLTGSAAEEMLAYFDRLDAMLADDRLVRRNWREKALRHAEIYLKKLQDATADDLLENYLGRLTLVAENRSWTEEVMAAVRERWADQARRVDPHHRPHYHWTRGRE